MAAQALPIPATLSRTDTERYAVECQSSYERGDPDRASKRGAGTRLFSGAVCEFARKRPGLREALRWTLIVRAEVGPIHRLPCRFLAHADAYSSFLTHPGLPPG